MENLHWGARKQSGAEVHIPLLAGDAVLATFVTDRKADTTTAQVGEQLWSFEVARKGNAVARIGDSVVYTAVPEKGRFDRSDTITATVGTRVFTFTREAKSDWIVELDSEKVAQFTGAGHGVRHVELELEEGVSLTQDEAVFLAWVARIVLEARLVGSTWILTLSLLLLTPFILWVFLL
ncbi:hypothetical protein [Corynebacterium sp.]|uniref:hypothetical protein n=1 Tax=Corynebacterium sp. TaxID=1720 RepID=UPI0026DAAF9B|nr:hypothetical protein [Corynebacterium sp.]MDO5076038.1 hypothetical protein [Corynebacterium sp.]